MPAFDSFEFARSRGIVWVCDIEGSSHYLNSSETAGQLEEFLQRLHWTSSIVIEAAGGKFIKWTGDGFLAWFETTLHRQLGVRSVALFEALWHLTFMLNVTQLGLSPERKFRIRHGVAYEHDALLTTISRPGGYRELDVVGRAVVLAFRLSGVESPFPGVSTQRELVNAYREVGPQLIDFRKWSPTAKERLRYFKNEKWGTGALYRSSEKKHRPRGLTSVLKQGKNAIAAAKGETKPRCPRSGFIERFTSQFVTGPEWCREVADEHVRFIREELLGTLENVVEELETIRLGDGGNDSEA